MKTSKKQWEIAQNWELDWHDSCVNSQYEEEKQLVYAEKMGLVRTPTPKTPYNFDLNNISVLDIGSGPYSLLLKCANYKSCVVSDPLMNSFPKWVRERYLHMGINHLSSSGEELLTVLKDKIFDEVWIYNVLEHVYDPKSVLDCALELGKTVRIFEWLDTPYHIGHPQTLSEQSLNKWLGGTGKTEILRRGGATGKAYFGVFKGKHYEG